MIRQAESSLSEHTEELSTVTRMFKYQIELS